MDPTQGRKAAQGGDNGPLGDLPRDSPSEEPIRTNRGWFTKGDPRIAPLAAKAQQAEGPAEVVDDDATLFDDMQHVRRRPKSEDRTQGQKDCRRWKEKNLATFMAKLADLEKAALTSKKTPEPASNGYDPGKDEGTKRI